MPVFNDSWLAALDESTPYFWIRLSHRWLLAHRVVKSAFTKNGPLVEFVDKPMTGQKDWHPFKLVDRKTVLPAPIVLPKEKWNKEEFDENRPETWRPILLHWAEAFFQLAARFVERRVPAMAFAIVVFQHHQQEIWEKRSLPSVDKAIRHIFRKRPSVKRGRPN